jgi:transcriptional regulator with XRE-family HTH domain
MTGPELKRLRMQAGLTQEQLGELVALHANTIARQERGEVKIREAVARLIQFAVTSARSARKGRDHEKQGTTVSGSRRAKVVHRRSR